MRRKKSNRFFINLFSSLLISLSILIWPGQKVSAAGASLFFTPSSGTFNLNGSFTVAVKTDTGGESINASDGSISFDSNLLEVVSISESNSVFTMWIVKPNFSNAKGTISFSGGMPSPGYNGKGGHLFNINFKSKKAGTAQLRFTSGSVLANDDKGTNILATMGSAGFIISPNIEPPKTGGLPDNSVPAGVASGEEYNLPVITSSSHPDQNAWYKTRNIKFSWKLPEEISAVASSLTKEPISDPKDESAGKISEKEFKDIDEGIWYFHLKFKDAKRWGSPAHFRVMIDDRPPLPFVIKVSQAGIGDWPILEFPAKDEESGIKHYEVLIGSLNNQSHIIDSANPSLKAENLEVGNHKVLIKAVDNAGNETYSEAEFNIEPIESPKITNFPSELGPQDKFYLSGTGLPNSDISIYIQNEEKIIDNGKVNSDGSGNWFFIATRTLANDRYVAWAEAVNKNGVKSMPSNKITFLVTPPVFARVGNWVINYFTVFASLLFVLLLIAALVWYLVGIVRKKLKKETVEAEHVISKYLSQLKDMVDEEFAALEKAGATPLLIREKLKTKQRIKASIDNIEKKIGKEVKDVENLLK